MQNRRPMISSFKLKNFVENHEISTFLFKSPKIVWIHHKITRFNLNYNLD